MSNESTLFSKLNLNKPLIDEINKNELIRSKFTSTLESA